MKCVEIQDGKQYVCGFLFLEDGMDGPDVLLLQKAHPEWMAGRENGIGGKVEQGETHHAAMVREFKEEAGLTILDWDHFATLVASWEGQQSVITFYAAKVRWSEELRDRLMGTEAEPVQWISLRRLHEAHTIPNVQWLVRMGLAKVGLAEEGLVNMGWPLLIVEGAGRSKELHG